MPNTAISLTLKASKALRGWLVAGHVLPLLFILLHHPEPVSLLFFFPAFFFWRQAYRAFGFGGQSNDIASIAYSDDRWVLNQVSGDQRTVELVSSTGFYCFWVFMVFRDEAQKTHRIFVAADSTDTESFRKLRVLLRFINTKAGFRF